MLRWTLKYHAYAVYVVYIPIIVFFARGIVLCNRFNSIYIWRDVVICWIICSDFLQDNFIFTILKRIYKFGNECIQKWVNGANSVVTYYSLITPFAYLYNDRARPLGPFDFMTGIIYTLYVHTQYIHSYFEWNFKKTVK